MNKMIRIALLGSAMMLGFATASQAADPYTPPVAAETPQDYANMGWYLRGDIGWSFLRWSGGDDDSAVSLGGGVGYQFNDYLRSDLRVDWAGDYDIGGGADMNVTTILGNLYLDVPTGTMITPYVGGGVGYGWASVHGRRLDRPVAVSGHRYRLPLPRSGGFGGQPPRTPDPDGPALQVLRLDREFSGASGGSEPLHCRLMLPFRRSCKVPSGEA
jgi:hypothetical protein